jgi:transposase
MVLVGNRAQHMGRSRGGLGTKIHAVGDGNGFFNKIKQRRRVATRYDKLAASYLAFVKLAAIRLWLRSS